MNGAGARHVDVAIVGGKALRFAERCPRTSHRLWASDRTVLLSQVALLVCSPLSLFAKLFLTRRFRQVAHKNMLSFTFLRAETYPALGYL